ncbi:MAG: VOC family protein [Gammaproteobacteria bacterium]|nr:VOC family protein [Gammaproteobacteria bacterium]
MSESALPQSDLGRVGQLALPVADLDRSVAFYRDQLGLRFLFQAPPGLAFFDCAGLRLMLDAPAFERGNRFGSVLYFSVDDLPTHFAALGARRPLPRPPPTGLPACPTAKSGWPFSATPTAASSP